MTEPAKFCFARVTPVGRSAIATLVVNGAQAISAIEKYFQPLGGRTFSDYPINRIVFGKWRHADGTHEELVAARVSEEQFEVHCHGGLTAIEALATALTREGGQHLSWQEMDLQACGDKPPYWKTVEQMLPACTTTLATQYVMQHANGEVENVIAQAEALQEAGEVEQAVALLTPYLNTSRCGKHLIEPWTVVIAGRPNAGKSCLMNQLVGYQRAIVHQQAGTTRDLLRALTVLDGWPIEFVDTAGIRAGEDAIEVAGIQLATSQLEAADLVLWVHDLTTPIETDFEDLLRDHDVLIVGNKSDLVTSAQSEFPLQVSAETGDQIEELQATILERLVPGRGNPDFKVLFCEAMDRRIQLLVEQLTAS